MRINRDLAKAMLIAKAVLSLTVIIMVDGPIAVYFASRIYCLDSNPHASHRLFKKKLKSTDSVYACH